METESGSWRLYKHLPEDRETSRIGGIRGISAKDRNKIPFEYKSAAFGLSSAETCFMFRTPNHCRAPRSLGTLVPLYDSSPYNSVKQSVGSS